MGIELYAVKPFLLGVALTWYFMRNRNKRPKTFEIREI
jgi:hypothetical protein